VSWTSIEEQPSERPWQSITETGIVFIEEEPRPAAPPAPEPEPALRVPREIVLRGILAAAAPPRARRLITAGGVAAFLQRTFALLFSAFVHIVIVIVFLGAVIYHRNDDVAAVAVDLPPAGESKEKTDDQGSKGHMNEPPPETPAAPEPEVAQPQPPAPETPKDVKPVTAPGPSAPTTPGTPAPGAEAFSGRGGAGRGDRLRRFGGNDASESAVELGLRWLARHEHKLGGWDANGFPNACPETDRCNDPMAAGDPGYSVGVTSLAILAFLGAGYSPKGGEHAEVIERALKYLVKIQDADGGLTSAGRTNFYNHSLATWALTEAYAITRDEQWKVPAQRAVDYLVDDQREAGGWDYYTKDASFSTRNDTSIAGWAVMALKSAQLARLTVPEKVFERARKLIASRTDKRTGELVYADASPGTGRRGEGLVAVGLVCRFYLGMKEEAPLRAGASRLMRNLPSWDKMREAVEKAQRQNALPTDHNMYYWYYGTLAMFQVGGEAWSKWNRAMRDMLVKNQRRDGHRTGSWSPEHSYIGREGGRVWATAVNVLNLEIYYRYLPLYMVKEETDLEVDVDPSDLLAVVRSNASQAVLLRAMAELAKQKGNAKAVQALIEKLAHADSMIRWQASKLLGEMGAKEALPALVKAAEAEPTAVKGAMLEHLARFKDASVAPVMIKALGDVNPRVVEGAASGLRALSGEDHGTDAAAWRAWYGRQR